MRNWLTYRSPGEGRKMDEADAWGFGVDRTGDSDRSCAVCGGIADSGAAGLCQGALFLLDGRAAALEMRGLADGQRQPDSMAEPVHRAF